MRAKKVTLLELLHRKVNVNDLLEKIYIDEDRLIDAALEQPTLMALAGQFRVQRMHVRVRLETKLDLVKSQVARRFRMIRDQGGKKEFTNPEVAERVELDPAVRRLRRKIDRATALEELAKNLSEVFRTRSDSLRIIVAAGKVSVHAKELELLRTNKKLAKSVFGIRQRWENNNERRIQ